MGIAGLHTLLKSIQKPCHLTKFKGQTLGVDAYGWLHRGTVACAIDLALGRDTRKHIDFVLNRVRMLLYFGVTPYIVFDGGMLPSKAETESSRAARREESKKNGMRLYHAGRVVQAQQELQKSVDVTPYMARILIEELKKLNVQYVVAPYEADAQLVYLEKQGYINGIISEDSDMLVFGAKRLLSKLDPHGDCIEINRADFTACREISLVGWSDESFRQMCILSGCDYLASIPGMGLKTAYRQLRKCKSVERTVRTVQFEGKSRVPMGYLEAFKRAELTFLHQWVFCPKAQKLVTLTPIPAGTKEEDMPFIGEGMDDEIAVGVACGNLDPVTKTPIEIKQSYPERSRMVLSRRQTLPSATEKRPTNRITSFFTPKRVPLGELDPNSLTPSPSQQQVLEDNVHRAWQSSPAPARPTPTPPSHLRSASTPRPLRASVTPLNSQRQNFLARASTVAPSPATKRPRLCSDFDDNHLGEPATEERSRFFPKPGKSRGSEIVSPPKTPLSTTPHVKKARKAEFGVFSDDSVEDIMTHLSHEGGIPTNSAEASNSTKVSNSTEDEAIVRPEEVNDDEKKETAREHIPLGSNKQQSINAKVDEPPVEKEGSTPGLRLHEKYGYLNAAIPDSTSKTKPSGSSQECPQSSRTMLRKTPLQRLGQAAVARSRSLNSLQRIEPRETKTSLSSKDKDGYESDCTSVRPSRCHGHGSEDLIVPDSEDSDELDETHPDRQRTKPRQFDVKKFAFAPKGTNDLN